MSEQDEIRTLRVLHLPPGLSDERREELFKQYGAVKTSTIRKSAKYTITFAEFPTAQHANEVFLRLHQLPVKGKRLSIEFANRNVSADTDEKTKSDEELAKKEEELERNKENYQEYMRKLNTWLPYGSLGQPIPPNLKYKYPEPTKTILLRIAIQMLKENAFYTQVLHLMNKMSLPPPFDELDEKYPSLKKYYDIEKYKHIFDITVVSESAEASATKQTEERPNKEKVIEEEQPKVNQEEEDEEEEESEFESDEEAPAGPQMFIPEKRKKPQPKKPLKIPKFVNPLKQATVQSTSTQKQRPEDMFELPRIKRNEKSKPITVKPPAESASTSKPTAESMPFIVQPSSSAEGFGLIFPAKKDDEQEEVKEKSDVITTDQLHNNKLSANDQRVLPVFKNYHPGIPSNRLYIKNLSKQVEESDLHFIYRRYILPSSNDTESEYNVRLMQEGRMKGQAFVTLPNVAQAQLALNETNGYILKDKPMVVQFAKVARH